MFSKSNLCRRVIVATALAAGTFGLGAQQTPSEDKAKEMLADVLSLEQRLDSVAKVVSEVDGMPHSFEFGTWYNLLNRARDYYSANGPTTMDYPHGYTALINTNPLQHIHKFMISHSSTSFLGAYSIEEARVQ